MLTKGHAPGEGPWQDVHCAHAVASCGTEWCLPLKLSQPLAKEFLVTLVSNLDRKAKASGAQPVLMEQLTDAVCTVLLQVVHVQIHGVEAVSLGKLQRQTRDELGALVQPFLGGRPVPKTLTALPEDLLAPLDTDAFASLVFMPNADAKGPRFSFTAGRLRSKLKRLKDAGVAGVITVRGPRSFLDDTGRDALRAMLTRKDRPTAIFAAGYYYALDIYAIASELGLSIPGDISLLGIDDPPSAAHLSPAPATSRQPLVQLGRLALGGLGGVATADDLPPHRATRRAKLIERGSVAPPA